MRPHHSIPNGKTALKGTEREGDRKLALFLDTLWTTPVPSPALFDPWNEAGPDAAGPHVIATRRRALACHLAAPEPRVLLVAEAGGWRGLRATGVALCSESLAYAGRIPRVDIGGLRLTNRRSPLGESTATVVWGALYEHGLADSALLWNTVPWHPPRNGPYSNRRPTVQEIAVGTRLLSQLLAALPVGLPTFAIGQIAELGLGSLGASPTALRHPANGGAAIFRAQIAEAAGLLNSRP